MGSLVKPDSACKVCLLLVTGVGALTEDCLLLVIGEGAITEHIKNKDKVGKSDGQINE